VLAVAQEDGVAADEVEPAQVAVEVDAHARPVQARRHLLDVRRLAGAVIAGDDHPPVLGEPGEHRQRGLAIEEIVLVDIGDMLVGLREGRHFHVGIDPEHLAHLYHAVGGVEDRGLAAVGLGLRDLGHGGLVFPVALGQARAVTQPPLYDWSGD